MIHLNLPGPMWKSNCPLNIITGCTTLSNKKCNQAFAITHNESFTSVWRNFGLIFCADLFSFIHIWGFSSMNCLTWSLQNLNVPFFEPFRGGPEWCCSFGILLKNSIIRSSISYAMSLSWSQAAKQPRPSQHPHHVLLLGWCSVKLWKMC